MRGQAGSGTIEGSGTIGCPRRRASRSISTSSFQNARLARSDDISATATGQLHIVNNAAGALIEGELNLGEVRYELVQQAAAEIPQLAGVRRRGEPLRPPNEQNAEARVPSIWRLNIRLIADNRIYVSGMGMESEWRAEDLRVTGTTATAQFVGQVRLMRGTLGAGRPPFPAGQRHGDLRRAPGRRGSISSLPRRSTMSMSASTCRAARPTRRSPSPPRPACRRTRSSRASCSAAR